MERYLHKHQIFSNAMKVSNFDRDLKNEDKTKDG